MGREPLTAAILVGGKSRRMGTDKALLSVDAEGTTVVEMVLRTVGEVVDDIVLAGANGTDYAFLGLPILVDRFLGTGPLGGIHAALSAGKDGNLLVVACDMPFLCVDLLRYMAAQPGTYDALVPEIGRLQPLHAIYAPACLPLMERELTMGRRQVSGWFGDANVQVIEQSIVQKFDPSLQSSFNMNTPDELAEARRLLANDG